MRTFFFVGRLLQVRVLELSVPVRSEDFPVLDSREFAKNLDDPLEICFGSAGKEVNSAKFPVKFPVSREWRSETGPICTGSPSQPVPSLRFSRPNPQKAPQIRAFSTPVRSLRIQEREQLASLPVLPQADRLQWGRSRRPRSQPQRRRPQRSAQPMGTVALSGNATRPGAARDDARLRLHRRRADQQHRAAAGRPKLRCGR